MASEPMTEAEIAVVLADHGKWLLDDVGSRANLSGADLRRADLSEAGLRRARLSGADLRCANLSEASLRRADLSDARLFGAVLRGADLSDADLRRADLSEASLRHASLRGADLRGASLIRADLSGANLRHVSLRGADLRGASLSGADLRDADLIRANLEKATLPRFAVCPEAGSFTAWKKLSGGCVAELLIPADARRTSSLAGRKCRAEFAQVVAITTPAGASFASLDKARSIHDNTIYKVGEMVRPDKYDDDIRTECSHGIHFFITRREAEEY